MAKEMTLDLVLEGRAATYGMLSRLYEKELDEVCLENVKSMRCPTNTGNVDVDKGYRLFRAYLNTLWERSFEDLKRDYLRVFIGSNTTGHSAAYPNESVHTSPDRLVMQDARDEVMTIYKAAGITNRRYWNAGEDHIAAELEYMQIMSKRALEYYRKGNYTRASKTLLAQYNFLLDHLKTWVPLLVEDMLDFAETDFYRGLAHLTKGFLEEDEAFLKEVLSDEPEAAKDQESPQACVC